MILTPETLALQFAQACMTQEPGARMIFFTFNNSDGLPLSHDEYVVVKFEVRRLMSTPELVNEEMAVTA